MEKTFFFHSGLPRSGSTLLSEILGQNPEFYNGPGSPAFDLLYNLYDMCAKGDLFQSNPKMDWIDGVVNHSLRTFYDDRDESVIFDKNFHWTGAGSQITASYGIENPKLICSVRDIDEILASFISMIHRNAGEGKSNFIDRMCHQRAMLPITDVYRCELVIGDDGILGRACQSLYHGLRGVLKDSIHLVEYNDLVDDTENTIRAIYDFLEQPYFEHDFTSISGGPNIDESVYGLADMHDVRPTIGRTSSDPKDVLPAEILEKYTGMEFWRS
jgi:sulfotransferase